MLSGVNSPHHCISSHELINIMHQGSTQLRIVWWWSELEWITRRVWKSALTYVATANRLKVYPGWSLFILPGLLQCNAFKTRCLLSYPSCMYYTCEGSETAFFWYCAWTAGAISEKCVLRALPHPWPELFIHCCATLRWPYFQGVWERGKRLTAILSYFMFEKLLRYVEFTFG